MAEHVIEFVIETSEPQCLDIQPISLKTKLNIFENSQQISSFSAGNCVNLRNLYKSADLYICNTTIKANNEIDYFKCYADLINNNQPAMK